MKFLFILLFLPLFSFAQSKDMLLGLWVKSKAQMKDGSRIVDHSGCGMDFIKYKFANDGIADLSNDVLFDGFRVPYRLRGDSLVVGGTLYNIMEVTKDTLNLSFFAPGAEDKQIPEYYFIKVPQYKVAAKASFDPALKDSVYQATNDFFPRCKGDLLVLMNEIATQYEKGILKPVLSLTKKVA
jgi:hypothetical protein